MKELKLKILSGFDLKNAYISLRLLSMTAKI